jgi:hypothetical protein
LIQFYDTLIDAFKEETSELFHQNPQSDELSIESPKFESYVENKGNINRLLMKMKIAIELDTEKW